MHRVLVINPGSTSTKIALFEGDSPLWKETLRHTDEELAACLDWQNQGDFRRAEVLRTLNMKGCSRQELSALVVRGGLLKPLPAGVYLVNEEMLADWVSCRYGRHASNLGGIIAYPWAREFELPLFTVDPVTVDEMAPEARLSGLQGLPRLSMSHALNMKAVARLAASRLGKNYADINLVVAHMGGGISVSAHRRGKMIDVNNANNEGPFAMERCGGLPVVGLIRECFQRGLSEEEMVELVTSSGGVYSYLGTRDFREVENRGKSGEDAAILIIKAMAYQVSKEIGAMAAVLDGEIDRLVLTGGMAHSELLTGLIIKKVAFIAPTELFPGEEELEALAAGALRVLRGEEKVRSY